ncbi:replication-relaxation family protein [Sporosarcina sp. FSL W7-1283]|uniref:replication-relaxation family protein n=1 Tax=Sporosarcina sp. FSL W7-1283 TaxID=2921560 RepID=UPI0030FB4A08
MAYVIGYQLSNKTERLLKLLISYRGMTAPQLARMFFATHDLTLSQEKSIYNDLAKLKKQGLVKSLRLQQNVSKGSLYYLTPNGYDCTKELLNMREGQQGEGWMPAEDGDYDLADLSYDLYMPPTKQAAHHLLLMDFFTELHTGSDELGEVLRHRHNLYAAVKYHTPKGSQQFRPDAEVLIDDQLFTIEIDRATESHEQLVQKFLTYRQYLDTHANQPDRKQLHGILFVVESRRREQGIRRRWHNILAAFYKVLHPYSHQLNLILTTMDQAVDTLKFEQDRPMLAMRMKQDLMKQVQEGEKVYTISHKDSPDRLALCITSPNRQYRIEYSQISQEFESAAYRSYAEFHDRQLMTYKLKCPATDSEGMRYAGSRNILYAAHAKPVIFDSFATYKMDPKVDDKLRLLSKHLEMKSFNPVINMPVTY